MEKIKVKETKGGIREKREIKKGWITAAIKGKFYIKLHSVKLSPLVTGTPPLLSQIV